MSTIPREFERFHKVSRAYSDPDTKVPGRFNDTFHRFPYLILNELRKPDQATIDAMVNTPWPEDMSAPDQMRAILNAAIDSILGPER